MNIPCIRPVILSGGFGTRLWPLSSPSCPKQFTRFFDGKTHFFAQTLQRFADRQRYLPPFIVGNVQHLSLIKEALEQADIQDASVIAEPVACSTGAAAIVTALLEEEPGVLHLLVPSDHHMEDEMTFQALVSDAATPAQEGRIMLFGITPDRPETGYGYIMPKEPVDAGISEINKFLEKPDKARAISLIAQGALWNSGIFLYHPATVLAEAKRINPDYYAHCATAAGSHFRLDYCLFLDQEHYRKIPSAAFDTLVMENTALGSVIAGAFGWSDVGSWESLWNIAPRDADNNLIRGEVITRDVSNSYIHSDGVRIAALGIQDYIVVARDNTILIAPIDKSQEVKYLSSLAEHGFANDSSALQLHEPTVLPYSAEPAREPENNLYWRPWGKYRNVARGKNYLIKDLIINPGCSLSLQRHEERAEHWVVMEGEATVEIEGEIKVFHPEQSVFIPRSARHRLRNNGTSVLKIIEIQAGNYLNEDDITRYEDMFGRI